MRATAFGWRDFSLRTKTRAVVLAPILALLLTCSFIGWLSSQQRWAAYDRGGQLGTISTVVISASLLIGVLGGVLATFLLSRNIAGRVSRLLQSFDLLANGMKFDSQDKSKDELGQLASGLAQASQVLSERAAEITELNWKLESVLRAVTEVSIIAEDLLGRVTIFNAGATKLLGYRPEEVIGRDLNKVLQGQADSSVGTNAGEALKSENQRSFQSVAREYETTYTRNDGLCLHVQVSIAPLKDLAGRVVGLLHVAQDVTPRKLLEMELRQKVEDLSSTGLTDTKRLSAALDALNNREKGREQPARPQPETIGKSPAILIVDDFEPNRLLIKAYLQNQGYVLHFASNGEEALQKVREHSFDLVLTDIEMPKMNGYKTASQIRALEQAQGRLRVPIVALSALEQLEPTLIGERSVWTSVLRKPLSKSQLLSEIKSHLKPVGHA